MPLYEYRCRDCGQTLELLQRPDDLAPKRCGFRCALDVDSDNDVRGFGALERVVSTFATVRRVVMTDHPGTREAAKAGLAVYANEGGGRLRRIDGNPEAPEHIDVGDPYDEP